MVVTRLAFNITDTGDYTIDLAQCLSAFHRKLIRQKQIFTVYGGMLKDSGGSDIEFATAPNNWVSKAAVNRGFKQWKKLSSHVLKQSLGARPNKWSDFKVYLDSTHHGQQNLKPVDFADVGIPVNEWDYSTFTQPKLIDPDSDGGLEYDADADQWETTIVGVHRGTGSVTTDAGISFYQNLSSVGLIRSWYESRPLPSDHQPLDAPVPALYVEPLSGLFVTSDDDNEHRGIIATENDQAPYHMDAVFGAGDDQLVYASMLDNSDGEPDLVTFPGFQALCGLVRVKVNSENGALLILDVESEGVTF